MSNVNDTYFDGHYKDIWRSIIPEELTVKEVDFMMTHFNLQPGNKVVDLMCGYGRHAIALAKKGIDVIAQDNLGDYTSEIHEIAEKEELPIKVFNGNVLDFTTNEKADLAICMGNSINFFNADDTQKILSNIYSFLNPGGHLLINSWTVAEIALKNFKEKSWSMAGDLKFLTDAKFLFHPTRIETECTAISPDGKTEVKMAIDYIFTINEMETMLSNAGFIIKDLYSIPGRKKFALGEPRLYLVAEKK